MKRLISFVLVLAMLFSFAVPAQATETVEELTISLKADKTEAQKGDTVTVSVSTNQTVDNVGGFQFYVFYDEEKVTYESSEVNEAYTETVIDHFDGEETVQLLGMNTSVTGDGLVVFKEGVIGTITFTVNEDVKVGDEITFSMGSEGMSDNTADMNDIYHTLADPITVAVIGTECAHDYVAGVCTECGEAEPGYVAPSVTVTLSLSSDDMYMVGRDTGAVMAFKEITVPYFDLGLYGLEEYYFISETYGDDGDGLPGSDLEPGSAAYADGKVTLMHLYLYALEVFYCGVDPEDAGKGYLYEEGLIGTDVFTVSGGVGSSFMNQFWGGDCNLNYYVNYEYPLASEGWGATADQILLRDGDMITLGHFSGWSFYGDPYSIFNYMVSDKETVPQGEDVTLTLYYAGANLGMTDGTAQNLNPYCLDVYCVPTDAVDSEDVTSWTYLGTSDENGQLVVNTADLEPNEYIVAVAGQYGVDFPDEICSTPGGVLLTVEEGQSAPVEPESNDYVFYSSESGMAVPGDADITVTELSVKNGKDKILAVDTAVNSATSLSATIFLYETVQDGETFQMGYKAVGDDVGTVILENDTYEIGKLADIPNQPFPGIAQGTFKIKNASHMAVEIGVNFRVVKSFGLDQATLALVPGAEGTLSVTTDLAGYLTTKLANCVEWGSSDESVVTVEGGKVTAVAPGTAAISASVGTKTASCEVTVAEPERNDAVVYEGALELTGSKEITVTELFMKDAKGKVLASYMGDYAGSWPLNIFLDGDQVSVGDTFEFGFTAEGADKDDAGFRIITGYMGNTFTIASYGYAMGSMQIQDSSGTTSVMIRPNLFPVSNFGLNQSELSLAAGGEATLSVTTSNGDVTSYMKPYVEWTSSDESIVTVEGGKVTAVAPGTATITATIGSKTASCEVSVESNNYTVWTGEMCSQYSNLDLYVSEWYIEGGKPFVLGSLLTYDGTQYGNISTTTFVDADQIQVGDQIKMGAVVSGEDAETGLKSISGDVGTIASYGSFTQQMVVTPTDNYKITNSFNVIRLGDLVLDDVTMLDNENPTLTVTSDTLDRWGRIYLGPLVQWSSSDPEVVTVEPVEGKDGPSTITVGKLTAYKAGTATITAKVGNDNISKTVSCTVTVVCDHEYINGVCTRCSEANPDYVAIETIELESYTSREIVDEVTGETVTALPLMVGGSEKLIVKLNEGANQGITWTSSDESVATVEDGVVTAVSAGRAVITATAGGADVMTTFAARNTAPTAQYMVVVEEAPAAGFTLTMPADFSITADQTINIPVTLGNAEGAEYNAFDVTVSYPEGLSFLSAEGENLDIAQGTGSVRIKGYGNGKASGTTAFTMSFKADAVRDYVIQADAAKVDNSAGAISANAPDAVMIDDVTVITVTGYNVTLPEEFRGESVAVPGTDYSFTIPEDYYDYTVTVKVGDDTLVDGQILTGTYTIEAEQITGAILVTMERNGKIYDVTIPADHFPNAADKAQFGVDYTATLKVKINYDYDVDVTIGGVDYTGYSVDEENYIFTIPGTDITGPIEFIVTAEENGQGGGSNMRTITFSGTGAGVAPVVSTSVVDGGTYQFRLAQDKMETGYTYMVTLDGEELTAEDGLYTVKNITGDITIVIEKILSAETTVEVYDYVTKDGGKQVKLVLVKGAVSEGSVFTYGGEKMFYSEQYQAWAYLDIAESEFTVETARAKVSTMAGSKAEQTVAQTCDVNGSGTVDINDAQLAYDIYKPEMYTDFATVSVRKFLNADVNGDMTVFTDDAAAVVDQIH